MSSVSCCSGGVMFVPDAIERASKSASYKDFIKDENAVVKKRKLFGRKEKTEGDVKHKKRSAA